MKFFYILKDGQMIGRTVTKEEAIEMIRARQKRETHFMLKAEFSIIEGIEHFVPYQR